MSIDIEDLRAAVGRFGDEHCNREDEKLIEALLEEKLEKAALWDLVLARLPHGITLNTMSPNYIVCVREEEFIEALKAVRE